MSDDEYIPPQNTKKSLFANFADSDSDDGVAPPPSAPQESYSNSQDDYLTSAQTSGSTSMKNNDKKSKGKTKGKGKAKDEDEDEDWEALLAAESKKNSTSQSNDASTASLVDGVEKLTVNDSAEKEASSSKSKKNKNKSKAASDASPPVAAPAPAPAPAPAAAPPKKLNAAARAALEKKQAAQAAEEARRKEQEEIERMEREEAAKAAAEEARKQQLREKRAEERRLKKEAEIKAGTYKTKKQQEEAARTLARLEAMKNAGLTVVGLESTESPTTDAAPVAKKKTASMYDSRKKKAATTETVTSAVEENAENSPSTSAAPTTTETPSNGISLPQMDDWETAADDWETAADAIDTTSAQSSTESLPGKTADDDATESDEDSDDDSDDSDDRANMSLEERIEESRRNRELRKQEALNSRSANRLRSPICVVLGHVDTGKTSLLDKIRRTNVQEGEAGGITQQIGATYFPMDRLKVATDKLNKKANLEYKVPGLLIIDTPGHEQFTNLRSRGSSLCDIAVLVIDIMHGLERQTIESINLLKSRKTPFVVALNKVDRMYGWKPNPNAAFQDTFAKQDESAREEFQTRAKKVMLQLAEQGLNSKLYYENENFKNTVSLIPTSAFTGEGVPDLLYLIVQLTQQMMSQKLMFCPWVQATILEVKSIDGFGTTADVVLVNGELKEGDQIVVCGMGGPIVTTIRALLTPPPLREMRVKSDYIHHKSISAAIGVKIVAPDLEKAVAGTELIVVHPDDEIEQLKEEIMEDYEKTVSHFKKDAVGVSVQASTLGSLEALLDYLRNRSPPIPVANVGIGPLHKKDIVYASTMHDHCKEYATILAFDVKVTPEAAEAAQKAKVKIFTADIIYHLTDQFDKYMQDELLKRQQAQLAEAVFPCIVKIRPQNVFHKQDPIVVGVDVLEGKLKIGTPLCVILPESSNIKQLADDGSTRAGPNVLDIGRVAGLEIDKKPVTEAGADGPAVALKIEPDNDAQRQVLLGRHFTVEDTIYSHITRASIDILKNDFRDQLTKPIVRTLVTLKDVFKIEKY